MLCPERAVTFNREKGKELCRICFSRRPTCLNLFETFLTSSMTIADMFMHYLGENIYPDEDLPELICSDCIEEVMETGNINEACKAVIRDSIWRSRLLKMESICDDKSLTRSASAVALQNILSEDNKYTNFKKKIRKGQETQSITLSYIYETKSFNLSDNCGKNLTIRRINEINQESKLEPCLHECHICKGVFLSTEELSKHKNLFHKFCRGFHCGKCHRKFETLKSLERHVKKYSFACKSQNGVVDEENHENSSRKPSFVSSSASVIPDTVGKSEEKLKGLPKNEKYSCSKCDSSFESVKTLKTHLREIHSSVFPYVCRYCGIGFISRIDLECHKYIHPKEFVCKLCKKEFLILEYYIRHIKFCQEKTFSHKCQICGIEMSSKANLKLHMSTHSLVKKFECQICHKRFSASFSLHKHTRAVHLKIKPHKCGICHKSFSYRWLLLEHLRIDSDERPYNCSFCNKSFKSKGYRCYHEKRVHKFLKPPKVNIIVEEDVLQNILL